MKLLLIFATGLDAVPLMGFDPEPTLHFVHPEDLDKCDQRRFFPMANTCSNALSIPILSTYDDFRRNVMAAITTATTFQLE